MAAKKQQEFKTDRRGFVHLKAKDGSVFKVLPESVEVWLEDGCNVVDAEKQAADSQPDDVVK